MTSEADVINESCQQQAWSGGASFYPVMDSFADLTDQLDAWAQFRVEDLEDIQSNLTILSQTNFNSGILTCAFSLNGKQGLTYAWARRYGMTANGPCVTGDFFLNGKASLVIPGSGLNPADQMVIQNSGYQNVLYSPVCAVGDGFIHVLPGMDFRFLKGANGLGYLRAGIDNYLMDHKSSLAILELVEACAILKWMQSQYAKLAVLGLSKGAYMAMLSAMLMSPNAAVCASGVSLASQAQGFGLAGGNVIPGVYDVFDQAEIVNQITASPTKFMFSKSTAGELAIMLRENTTEYTSSLLSSANVTHVTHSAGHRYAPNLGTWLAGALV